jgi:hypothetical protein
MKTLGDLKQLGTLLLETRPLVALGNRLESRFSRLIMASYCDASDFRTPITPKPGDSSEWLPDERTDLTQETDEPMPLSDRITTRDNFPQDTSSIHHLPVHGEKSLTVHANSLPGAIKQLLHVVQSASANEAALRQCKRLKLSINQPGMPRIFLLLSASHSELSLRIRVPDEPTLQLISMHQALLEQSLMRNAGTQASISMTVDLMDQ